MRGERVVHGEGGGKGPGPPIYWSFMGLLLAEFPLGPCSVQDVGVSQWAADTPSNDGLRKRGKIAFSTDARLPFPRAIHMGDLFSPLWMGYRGTCMSPFSSSAKAISCVPVDNSSSFPIK